VNGETELNAPTIARVMPMKNKRWNSFSDSKGNYFHSMNVRRCHRRNRSSRKNYDDENQLISVWSTNHWREDYVYDGMNRRRITRQFTWQSSAWVETNEVRYIYDVSLVIQERDTNNIPLVTYTRGNDLGGSLQGAGGIGGLLARTDNGKSLAGDPNASAYYYFDGNGNVAGLINSNGFILAQYTYDPFGNILSMSGPLAAANTYRFSSKEWDENAGLYYYGRRFYDPILQRWLNHDPIGEWGGYNLFEFVGNDPINSADILGLWQATCTAGDGLGGKLTVGKNSGQWNGGAYGGPTAGFSLNLDLKDSGTHTPGWSPGAQADVNLGKNFSGSASVDGDGSSVDLSHPFGKSPLSGSMGSDGPGASLSLGESESVGAGASYYSGSTSPASPPVQAYHGTDGSLYIGPPGTQPLDHGFPQQPTPYSGGGQNLVQNASPPGCGCH
jgi:RHS repeat-associated protein